LISSDTARRSDNASHRKFLPAPKIANDARPAAGVPGAYGLLPMAAAIVGAVALRRQRAPACDETARALCHVCVFVDIPEARAIASRFDIRPPSFDGKLPTGLQRRAPLLQRRSAATNAHDAKVPCCSLSERLLGLRV